jgi:hypothetical protein
MVPKRNHYSVHFFASLNAFERLDPGARPGEGRLNLSASFEPSPSLVRRLITGGPKEDAKTSGPTVRWIGRGVSWRPFDEAERDEPGDASQLRLWRHAEVGEVPAGDDEVAVVAPAMVRQLQIDAIEYFAF